MERVNEWENKLTETDAEQKWKKQTNVESNPGFVFTIQKTLNMALKLSFIFLIWEMMIMIVST